MEHVHGRLPVVRAESGHSSPSIGGILLHSLLTTAEVSSVAAVCLWEEEQISESESEDEENEIIYNPKNLPLGWDGKVSPPLPPFPLLSFWQQIQTLV